MRERGGGSRRTQRRATASTARAWRRAARGDSGPAGSSTTKAVVPGKRRFCHEVAVPR